MSEPTNQERADRAARIIEQYAHEMNQIDEAPSTNITDILSDFLHVCYSTGIDFDESVNVTLGLSIVRTSPDHGTALDIAGTGRADPSSLIAALRLAADLARARGFT